MASLTEKEREAVRIFAAIGGRSKSDKKTRAVRRNGKKGGRPKGSGKNKSEQSTK